MSSDADESPAPWTAEEIFQMIRVNGLPVYSPKHHEFVKPGMLLWSCQLGFRVRSFRDKTGALHVGRACDKCGKRTGGRAWAHCEAHRKIIKKKKK